jgi:hypothetical protein
MNILSRCPGAALLGLALAGTAGSAQTDGHADMTVQINDYVGTSGADHWTLVWVTTEAGDFIKTLWKQGTHYAFTSSQWTTHTPQWNVARGGPNGSTIVDGYTSATATTYTGTNSPVILTWNCRDTNNLLVADGTYKFWVQYAENSGAGPYTTNGLLWVKGPAAFTTNYPNLGANFTNMRATWTPSAAPPVAPTITSGPPTGTGTVGVPYTFTCTATGTAPIGFRVTAGNLPPGLALSGPGVISGTPTTAGTYGGTITATNGTLPDAAQAFSIVISVVPATITSVQLGNGTNLVMAGVGPTNGTYTVLISSNVSTPVLQWTPIATNTFDSAGRFGYTNPIDSRLLQKFYLLRVP